MGRGGTGAKAASATSIEITFVIGGTRCRERLQLKPTPSNLKLAAKHKDAIDVGIAAGTFDYAFTFPNSRNRHRFKPPTARGTVIEFLQKYLDACKAHVSSSTWDDYRKTINNVISKSSLAHLSLADLDRVAIKEFVDVKLKDAGNKRIANVLSCVRSALADAVMHNVLQDNVLVGYGYKKKAKPKEDDDVDPLNAIEQSKIVAQMQPRFANHFQFAFWTGLRTSEQVALTWADIDLTAGVVHVTKAQTRSARSPETTKTPAGRRDVKLLKPAIEALERQRSVTGDAGPSGRVWQLRTPKAAHAVWSLALRKAGVKHRSAYQTRHTYASMLLTADEPVAWLSKQMGHGSVAYTLKVYADYIPGMHPNAGAAAVEMFALVPA